VANLVQQNAINYDGPIALVGTAEQIASGVNRIVAAGFPTIPNSPDG
jgi:hypothetical protein